MCGIVGRIVKSGVVSEKEIDDALQTIAYRGPDDRGIYISKNVALGHNRLSIIDIAHGHQPMHFNGNRKVSIVYNGEVYNFNDLRRKIVLSGEGLDTYTDTEVILVLYIIYGVKSFEMLNGMYSFCIYDEDKDDIYLCRDRFGIKPLYYMNTDKAFSFASEVKALKVFNDYKFEENFDAINEYLTFQFYISDETPYKNINALTPGSYLHYKNGDITIEGYYTSSNTLNHDISYDEAKYNVFTLLEDSIKINTISDVPIGTYLSGGIDSSIITSVLGASHNDVKISFSGAFKESEKFDETKYAKSVSKKYEISHNIIYPDMQGFIDNLENISYLMDYPESGPGVYPQYMVSKLASEHVKVVLGGQGGDEIFGGYARYFIAYLEQSLKGAIHGTQDRQRHIAVINELVNNLPILKNYTPMLQSFWREGLFDEKDKRYYSLINRLKDVENLFNSNFIQKLSSYDSYEKFSKVFAKDDQPYFNRMTMFDTKYALKGLLHVEDRVSMAHSLESRVPFLDYRLVDYVNSIPPIYKFKDGKLKNILIDAFQALLPKEIVNRKDKQGFPMPLDIWKKEKKMKEFLADTLMSKKALQRGIYDKAAFENEIFKKDTFSRGLWGVLNYELWLLGNKS